MDRLRNPFVPGAGIQPPEWPAATPCSRTPPSTWTASWPASRQGPDVGRPARRGEDGVTEPTVPHGPGKGLPHRPRRGTRRLRLARIAGARVAPPRSRPRPEAPRRPEPEAGRVLANFAKAFKVNLGPFGLSVDLAPGEADTGDIEQDLPRLLAAVAQAAADRNTAIALFVDEVQYLSAKELAAIIVACHESATRAPLAVRRGGPATDGVPLGQGQVLCRAPLRLPGDRSTRRRRRRGRV